MRSHVSGDVFLNAHKKVLCNEHVSFSASCISEALLGVLGIRDNWQNNFRDKRLFALQMSDNS